MEIRVQVSNVRRIIIEDFPKDDRETVGKLAAILNQFMEEMVQLTQGNIDTENLNRSIVKIDVTVDANGLPTNLTQINTNLISNSGHNVINVQSLSGGVNVVSTPYIDYTYQGNGRVKVNKIFGLPPNKKIRVTIEFIA